MICAFSDEVREAIYTDINVTLNQLVSKNKPLNLEDLLKSYYDQTVKAVDEENALAVVQLIPEYINLSLADSKELTKHFMSKNLDMNKLNSMRFDFEDIETVQSYVEVTKSIGELAEQQREIDNSVPQEQLENGGEAPQIMSFRPEGAMVTYGYETSYDNVNQDTYFAYSFLRELNANILGIKDFKTLTYNGHTGFRLKMVTGPKLLESGDMYDSQKNYAKTNPEDFKKSNYIVLTDNQGNTLYFDQNYNISLEKQPGYKAIYFTSRKPQETLEGEYKHTTKSGQPTLQTVEEIANTHQISVEEANKLQQEQFKQVLELQNELQETGEDILLDIEYLSEGFPIELATKESTRLNEINIPLTYKESVVVYDEIEKAYKLNLINPQHTDSIYIRSTKLSDNLQKVVTELLFNENLQDPNKFGEDKVLKANERHELLTKILGNKSVIKYNYRKTEVLPSNIVLNLNENGETIQKLNPTKEEFINLFFNSDAGSGTVVKENGKNIVKNQKNKFFIQSSLLTQNRVRMATSVNGNNIVIEDVSYSDIVKENSLTVAQVFKKGKDNIIMRAHPYLKFTESDKSIAKRAERARSKMGEVKQEAPKKGPENPFTKREINVDDLLRSKRLDKNVTKEQIKQAEEWYKNSPIYKLLGYNQAFNIVNSDAYATFNESGITLFNGSNATDLYHEAWHAFTQMYLTLEQKEKLYNEVKNLSGTFTDHTGKKVKFNDATYLQIEEFLAEDFRSYMLSGGTKIFTDRKATNSIFRKILDFLKYMFGGTTSVDSVTVHTQAKVKELYDKLRVGNLNEYNASVKNMMFGKLNKSKIKSVSDTPLDLSYDETAQVIRMLDSIVSEYLDNMNKAQGTNKFTVNFLTNKHIRENAYYHAYDRLVKIRDEKSYPEDTSGRTETILNQVLANIVSVADYHTKNSEFITDTLSDESKIETIYENELEATGEDKGFSEFISQSNINPDNYIKNTINYLISTLPYKVNNKLTVDRFGVQVLADRLKVATILQDVLATTIGPEEMYKAMVDYAQSSKPYAEVIDILKNRMSDPSKNQNIGSMDTWFQLNSSFSMHDHDTIVTLSRKRLNKEGKTFYDLVHKLNRIDVDNAKKAVDNYFRITKSNTHMIINDEKYGNILDAKSVYEKWNQRWGSQIFQKDILEFLTDVGFELPNSVDFDKEFTKAINNGVIPIFKFKFILKDIKAAAEDNTGAKVITALASKTDGLFSTSGSLLDPILEIIAKYSPDINAKMVTTASNDPLFTLDPHSSQTRIVNSINKLKHRNQTIDNNSVEGGVKHLQHLSTRNPFNGWQNALVSSLFDSTGKRNNNTLISGLLMGVEKIEDTKHIDGQKSTKLSKEDKYLEDLHLMLRRGTPAMMRYGTKGKETFVGVKDLGLGNEDKFLYIDIKKFTDENLSEANTEFVNRMIGWLDAELVRVLEFNKADTPYKNVYKTYYKNGKDFYLFNGMLSKNTIKKIKDYYNIEEGKTSTDDLVLLSQTSLHDEKLSEIRNDIYNDLSYFMEMTVAEDMKLFNKRPYIDTNLSARIANTSKETNKDKQKVIAVRAHTYNYMLRNLDMIGLLFGDPAQYDMSKEDFHKRIGAISSGGLQFPNDMTTKNYVNTRIGRPYAASRDFESGYGAWGDTLKTGVIKDVDVKSASYDYMMNIYTKEFGLTEAQAKERLGAYEKMTEADAQGLISFDTYRILSIISGKWDWAAQEPAYQKIIAGEELKVGDVKKYFPPRKLQYYGNLENNLGQDSKFYLPLNAFHKYSLMPLIPGNYGEEVDKLHDEMIKQGMDYIIFESASKLNTITSEGTPDEVYESYDSVELSKNRKVKDNINFTPNNIFLEYLKDQTEVNDKFKGKTSLPSQIRKIILSNLADGGEMSSVNRLLKDNYLKTLKASVELNKKLLVKELGLSYTKDGKTIDFTPAGMQRMAEALQRELSERDIAEHELSFIQVNKHGKLKVDLSFAPSAEKLEAALVALVNKRVVKGKVNGEPLVQAASTFLTDNDRPTNATEEQKLEYGTNGLRFYMYDKNTGIRSMQVKISMQGKYKALLKRKDVRDKAKEENVTELQALNMLLKDKAWLSENKKMITMFGVRIPTQAPSSADVMEIAEFLPESSGNIIIPPSEIVAKTGSDFDVDKMFIMMANLIQNGAITENLTYDSSISDEEQETLKSEIKELAKKRKKLIEDKLSEEKLSKEEKSDIYKEFKESIDTIYKDIRALQRDTEENPENKIANDNAISIYENTISLLISDRDELIKDKTLRQVSNDLQSKTVRLASASPEALQNDLMYSMIDIMVRPDNFVHLTSSIDGKMAENKANEMAQYQEYNPSASLIPEYEDLEKGIYTYQTLLPSYNADKHDKNNRAMAALGQGAIDTSFSPVFNMENFTLKPSIQSAKEGGKNIDLTILFPYNKSKDGGIDLSRLKSQPNRLGVKEDIDYALNLLMNGWVDAEKGAWIFNVHGTEELEPVLVMMLKAGVPFDDTVEFLSNPLIKEFIDLQFKRNSLFDEALNGVNYGGSSRMTALTNMLTRYSGKPIPESFYDPRYSNDSLSYIQELRKELIGTDMINASQFKVKGIENIEDMNAAIGAFFHFLELDAIGSKLTEFKLHMNYDTTTSKTLFDSTVKHESKKDLRSGNFYDQKYVDSFLENTPIGIYDVSEFQEELWSQVFKIRNNTELKKYLNNYLSTKEGRENLKATFGTGPKALEDYTRAYLNNIIKYLFQNMALKRSLSEDLYKGLSIKKTLTKKEIEGLQYGATVKDGMLLLSKSEINKQFDTNLPYDEVASYTLGLAPLEASTFVHTGSASRQEYTNYVIEREYLRHTLPVEDVVKSPIYSEYVKEITVQNTGKNKTSIQNFPGKSFEDKINKLAYEYVLRDMALSNIFNMNSLFNSKTGTVADQLHRIKKAYPEMVNNYAFFQNIVEMPGRSKSKNIKAVSSKAKKDVLELVAENIKSLQNHPDVFVRDFFTKLPMYAFLQTGNDTKNPISILRYMPQQDIITMLSSATGGQTISNKLLERYTPLFNINNKLSNRNRYRFQDYINVNDSILPSTLVPEFTYVENITTKGQPVLAKTTNIKGNRVIQINPNITVDYFFKYFEGFVESATSEQKKLTLEKLSEQGYTIDFLKQLITNKDLAEKFLVFHEQSHIDNKDWETYYKQGENLLTEDKVAIEVRANIDAINKTILYKQTKPESVIDTLDQTKEIKLKEKPKNYDFIPLKDDNTSQIVKVNDEEVITSSKYELFPGVYANEEQKEAIDQLVDFILGDPDSLLPFSSREDKFRMLKGRGGTGKTTIIEKVVNIIEKEGNYNVGYIAPTHKAKSVLETSLNKSGGKKRSANTLASALGIKLDEATGKFTVDPYINPSIGSYDVVIIDESSMVNDNLIERIKETVKSNAAVIFMGDNVQLPPVGQEADSSAFKSKTSELSKRMRQEDDSPILPITDKIAANVENESNAVETVLKPEDRVTNFDSKNNEGVIYENNVDVAIDMFISDYKVNPESTKMVTFNNEKSNANLSVKDLNQKIRKKLHPNAEEEYIKGEQLTAYNTVLDNKNNPIIENSVDYTILEVRGITKDVTYKVTADSRAAGFRSHTIEGLKSYNLKVKNNLNGKVKVINVFDKASINKITQEANKIRQTDKQLAFKITEGFIRMEYGYAVTSHKSQGSTYRNVYVMEDNILGGGNLRSAKQKNQSLYVATSRASNKLVMLSENNVQTNKDLVLENPSQETHIGKVKTKSTEATQYSDEEIIKNNSLTTFIVEEQSKEPNTYNLNIDSLISFFGEDAKIIQENKEKIDSMISDIKEMQESNQSITFFNNYGLSLKKDYPQTFEYLSKALAENFGFTNKSYEESVQNIIPRGITDETIQKGIQNEIEEAINKLNTCKN